MKRLLSLILVLALTLTAGISVAAGLEREHDHVVFTETTLAGDVSAVSDVTLAGDYVLSQMGNPVQWHTLHQMGSNAEAKTDCSIAYGDISRRDNVTELYLSSFNFGGVSSTSGLDDSDLMGYAPIVKELATGIPNGGTITRRVDLRDFYYGYLPISCFLRWDDIEKHYNSGWFNSDSTEELLWKKFNDFFHIPLPADIPLYVSVSVSKNTMGDVCSFDINLWFPDDSEDDWDKTSDPAYGEGNSGETSAPAYEDSISVDLNTLCAATDRDLFFSFRLEQGNVLDFSEVPDGFGIYAISLNQKGDDVDPNSLRNLCPLPDNTLVRYLTMVDNGRMLAAVTVEDEVSYLRVIDPKTGNICQTTPLDDFAYPDLYRLDEQEDVLMLTRWDGGFQLWAAQADGTMTLALEGQFPTEDMVDRLMPDRSWDHSSTSAEKLLMELLGYNPKLHWDGQRLLVLTPSEDIWAGYPICLTAFTEDGVTYCGWLDCSLTVSGQMFNDGVPQPWNVEIVTKK